MQLQISPSFRRAYRRFTRNNRQRQIRIDEALLAMSADIYVASLRTHKLSGNLATLWACSCGYGCRIVFEFVENPSSGEQEILLIDIGTHDDVY